MSVGGVTSFTSSLAGDAQTQQASLRGADSEERGDPSLSLPLPVAPGRGAVAVRSANGQSRISRREDERPGSFRSVEQVRWRS